VALLANHRAPDDAGGARGPGLERGIAAAGAALTAAALALLLYSAWCAFTHSKFFFVDYGRYTTMIWNSGRGEWFRLLARPHSYLRLHLSFSLALLGPLFRLWDHPFLLSVAQWLFIAGGAALLAAAGRARGLAPAVLAALTAFHTGYVFTQSVHLCEFHGVSAYLFLVPWLYYALTRRQALAWLPLCLILGLREEAGLMVAPLCWYMAARDRWRPGYLMAAAAAVYALAAVFALFPLLNGRSLFAARQGKADPASVLASFTLANNLCRLRALGWVALPALPLLRRGWRPLLAIPAAALVLTLGSAFKPQFSLELSHPAAVMALLSVALAQAAAETRGAGPPAGRWRSVLLPAAWLLAATLAAHAWRGFLPGGGRCQAVYRRVHPAGLEALWLARQAPRAGLLATDARLAAFVANRRDVLTWEDYDPARHDLELVFDHVERLAARRQPDLREGLRQGEWGCVLYDGTYALLRRGGGRLRNADVLADMRTPIVRLAYTKSEGGGNRFVPGRGVVREWRGRRAREAWAAYGGRAALEPGSWRAVFRFQRGRQRGAADRAGSFEVWQSAPERRLAAAPVAPGGPAGAWETQSVALSLETPATVEPRVRGQGLDLRLERVQFEREAPSAPPRAERSEARFPAAYANLDPARESARRALLAELRGAETQGAPAAAARINAALAREAWQAVARALQVWEGQVDPASGLIPRSLTDARWNGDDVAADCWPFLLLASRQLQPEGEGLWLRTLAAERRLGGVLPQDLLLPGGELDEQPHAALVFAAAEFAKDGLLSPAERLGRGPWFERLEELGGALCAEAAVSTAAGPICASDTEVNGDVLQVMARLYWATRRPSYLELAERTAEAYLFDVFPKNGGLPALYWDFAAGAPRQGHPHAALLKFRDHGNEIIPGLAELYFLERRLGRPQAERYREPLRRFLDRILTLGRTPDGLWYDAVLPATGEVKARVSDNWGYVALALQAFDQAEGGARYAAEIQRAMRAAAARQSFAWEGRDPDGLADALEGMLYLLRWFDLPECRQWVDDELEVLLAKQDASGFVEGRYLDGNFMRTALLYAACKTQGIQPQPWRSDLQVGAARDGSGGGLCVHVQADGPWQGVLRFDAARHRLYWNLPADYARLNSAPEWYAVEDDEDYEVAEADGAARLCRGRELLDGLPAAVEGGRPLRLTVRRRAR